MVHGLRALTSPMRRMKRFMVCSFVRSWVSRRWWVGLVDDVDDRDQRQAQVADLLQQAVQRGLVDDRAVEDGGAVALVA